MISLQVSHINKSFSANKKRSIALTDISFDIDQPEIFGLIGPDGAGKTTLFRILTTLLLAESGEASIHGFDLVKEYKKIRLIVGYMPGRFSLYEDLSVEENLHFYSALFNTTVSENYDQIKNIYQQLEPFKKRRAGNLSGGMKQKLALCCALVHKPKYLFLDEPTTGVDPVSRTEFWAMLKNLRAQGICIVVSTPYMDEARLCDRIAFIQGGQLLSIVKPEKILENYSQEIWSVKGKNRYRLIEEIRAFPLTDQCNAFGQVHHITFKSRDSGNVNSLQSYLHQQGYSDFQIEKTVPGLEDYFIDLLIT